MYGVHFVTIACGFYFEFSKVLVSHISNHEDKLRGAGGSVKGGEQEINHRETSSQGETDYRKPRELN